MFGNSHIASKGLLTVHSLVCRGIADRLTNQECETPFSGFSVREEICPRGLSSKCIEDPKAETASRDSLSYAKLAWLRFLSLSVELLGRPEQTLDVRFRFLGTFSGLGHVFVPGYVLSLKLSLNRKGT